MKDPYFFTIVFFVFGGIVGSFINMLAYRIPLGKSIVLPPSSCPKCNEKILKRHNLPIVGYLMLGGQCFSCKEKIGVSYFITEILTASVFAIFFLQYGFSILTLYFLIFSFFCISAGLTDYISFGMKDLKDENGELLGSGIIPNSIVYSGLIIGLALSYWTIGLQASAWGAFLGFFSLYSVMIVYKILFKVEGMGWGDFKLNAMIGCYLGAEALIFVILIASILGTIIGVVAIIKTKNRRLAIPFGPMLSTGALFYALLYKNFESIIYNLYF